MGQALQVMAFYKQSLTGSNTWDALAPGTGDSLTFQNVPQGSPAYVSEIWGVDNAAACEFSIYATRWHDQTYGIRGEVPSSASTVPVKRPWPISPQGIDQPIYPSDVMVVQANGTASDNANLTMCVYYENLPGIDARLASYDFVKTQTKNLVGIHVALTPGAGNWGSAVALNASDNRLHAGVDYAVLGFTSNLALAAVGLSGVDTGNLRTGGPVLGDANHDANLFVDFARAYSAPLIPVINANNAGAINVQAAHTTATATVIDVMLAELKTPFTG